MLFRHRKTGGLYRVLAFAIDTTNARHGAAMVVYCPVDNGHTIFVRDDEEFHRKFEPAEASA